MPKWIVHYYRPLSGPAIQADVLLAPGPGALPVFSDSIGVEHLEGDLTLIQAAAIELGINRGLRFALEH